MTSEHTVSQQVFLILLVYVELIILFIRGRQIVSDQHC